MRYWAIPDPSTWLSNNWGIQYPIKLRSDIGYSITRYPSCHPYIITSHSQCGESLKIIFNTPYIQQKLVFNFFSVHSPKAYIFHFWKHQLLNFYSESTVLNFYSQSTHLFTKKTHIWLTFLFSSVYMIFE